MTRASSAGCPSTPSCAASTGSPAGSQTENEGPLCRAKAGMVKLWVEYAALFSELVEIDERMASDTEIYRASIARGGLRG